jgi:hypothetical protein
MLAHTLHRQLLLNLIISKQKKTACMKMLKASKSHYADHGPITREELRVAALPFAPTVASNGFRTSM